MYDLTTADYNWPTSNPDGIAMWLLKDGIYRNSTSSNLKLYRGSYSTRSLGADVSFIKLSWYGDMSAIFPSNSFSQLEYDKCRADGSVTSTYAVLTRNQLQNNLSTVTSGYYALDAYQGKVLNDKIGGDLSTLTTTDKTSLIAAINELVTRVAALEGA